MQVKDIIIGGEKEYIIDWLIRKLIENNISYVQIENELHFEDYILRFYETKELLERVEKKLKTTCYEGLDLVDMFLRFKENPSELGLKFIEPIKPTTEKLYKTSSQPKLDKNSIKAQNRKNNQYIKTLKNRRIF